MMRSWRDGSLDPSARLVLGLAGLVAAVLVLMPLAMLVFSALRGPADALPFEPGARWSIENLARLAASSQMLGRMLPDTLIAVGGTVAATSVLAFLLAWLVTRTDLPGRGLVYMLVLLPLLIPTNILAVAWIYLMGPRAGWINRALRALVGAEGSGPIDIFSMGGLILCQTLALTPYVFLLLMATLARMNPALEEASAAAGASQLTTFRRITLPVLLPGLLAPVILASIIAFEQFELPLMIGLPARLNIFSYRIYYELNPSDGLPNYGAAAAISLVFLALAVVLLVLYNRAVRHSERYTTIIGKSFQQKRLALGRWRGPSLALAWSYIALAALLPVAVLVWTSFYGYAPPSLAALSGGSTKAYAAILADPRFWLSLRNTLLVATVSAVVVTGLGLLLGLVIVRTRLWWRGSVDFLSFLSIGIPSVIVGLATMVLLLSFPNPVYGTVWALLAAYCYRLATTTRMARSGLMQIHPELEEASAVSGARWLVTQRRIVLPLMRPTITSALALFFIIGVREFTIPLVLASEDNIVLSVFIWRLYQGGQTMETAALSTLVILCVVPLVLVLGRASAAHSR